jgi:regulatory protein
MSDPCSVARIICLRLLDRQARTRAELATALSRKGIPDDAASTVLDRFAEVGLIDDAAFAQRFAATRHAERRMAPRAITAQLRRRGVADETIADAVSVIDTDSERRTARELVEAKLARLSGLDSSVATRRLTGLLARRGYSSSVAFAAVREALAERGAELP